MAKGYTKFENDYFSYLSSLDLTGAEFRVLLFILRQSACYHRGYTKDCAYSFIANGTGLSVRSVQRAIASLIEKKMISIANEPSGKRSSSYHLCVDKLGFLSGQTWSFRVDKNGSNSIPTLSTKESKESKDKQIKEKERASLTFSPCETVAMREMDEEKRMHFIELLPEGMRNKNPDDYSDEEWDIYDEWRYGYGLV